MKWSGSMDKKTAIIDIGSNTVRLVIYKYDEQGTLHELANMKKVARLRSYIDEDGIMNEEGVNVLKELLLNYKQILQDFDVSEVHAAATAAVRQAENQEDIVDIMQRETGIELQILTEEQEAYFGFVAVAYSMATSSAITIDMGGGSTEITLFENKVLQHTHSFPFGTVSLKQRFIEGDKMTEAERDELIAYVKEQFESLPWIVDQHLPIIGIGGSARNIAQIHQQQNKYPLSSVHHYEMKKDEMDELSHFLWDLSFDELNQLEGLSADRADIILPALEVFRTLMDVVHTSSYQFTKKGLREGIIINKILQESPDAYNKYNIFGDSSKKLAISFGRSEDEQKYIDYLVTDLYKQTCREFGLLRMERELEFIRGAAPLYSIGEFIEQDTASQHTFYLIANQSIPGITHHDRVRMALIASYKNKGQLDQLLVRYQGWFTKEEIKEIRMLGAILKFIFALNVSKRRIVKQIDFKKHEEYVHITFTTSGNAAAESYAAERQKKHVERVLRLPVTLEFIEER